MGRFHPVDEHTGPGATDDPGLVGCSNPSTSTQALGQPTAPGLVGCSTSSTSRPAWEYGFIVYKMRIFSKCVSTPRLLLIVLIHFSIDLLKKGGYLRIFRDTHYWGLGQHKYSNPGFVPKTAKNTPPTQKHTKHPATPQNTLFSTRGALVVPSRCKT